MGILVVGRTSQTIGEPAMQLADPITGRHWYVSGFLREEPT
jgi:hypothetical protein